MANPIQTYPTRNRFPVIGTRNVTYFATDTSVEYIWNGTGYVPQNLFVKRVGNNNPNSQGDVSLPIETVASTTTTLRKAETKTVIADTDKVVLIPTTGNLFLTTWTTVKSNLKAYFDTFYEKLSNKAINFSIVNDILYPTVKAVYDFVLGRTGTTTYITTGNQTTTSNVASDITGLAISLEANKRYRVYGVIRLGCNNTGGVNFAATIPTASKMNLSIFGFTTSVTAFIFRLLSVSGTLGGAYNTINSPAGFLYVLGEVETGANAGNLQMQFASGVNTQTSTIFQLGTWLNATELL